MKALCGYQFFNYSVLPTLQDEKCMLITYRPLMWACRISDHWCSRSSIEISIIKLLLSHGADIWAQGQSSVGKWSPLKLARYHGASTEITKLLTPKKKTKTARDGKKEVWDDEFHTSRRAKPRTGAYCDLCLMVS